MNDAVSRWRISTYSGDQSNCVEVDYAPTVAKLRDSKSPAAGTLTVATTAMDALIRAVRQR